MYKETLALILQFLNKLFNAIFDSGNFPESCCKSIITPIYKKGSRNDPSNYRAISLIDSLCKIFMGILSSRLNNWCEENNVLDESQAGFRQKYTTIDNVFNLMAVVQKYLTKKGGRFYCIFIDFEKAFDNVQHSQIWKSFERNNIKGKFCQIMKSLYQNTESCVKCNNKLTEYFKRSNGTRQGCVTSPKIFSLLVNDLIKYLQHNCGEGVYITEDVSSLYSSIEMRVLEHFLTHKTHKTRHQITQFKRVTPFNASNDLTRLTLSVYLTLYNIFISPNQTR